MRTYLIDEIKPEFIQKIRDHFTNNSSCESPIDDIYWIKMPENLLTATQKEHLTQCGPYVMSLEIGDTWVKLELLVRPPNVLNCSCMNYATPEQRKFGMDFLEDVFQELEIPS